MYAQQNCRGVQSPHDHRHGRPGATFGMTARTPAWSGSPPTVDGRAYQLPPPTKNMVISAPTWTSKDATASQKNADAQGPSSSHEKQHDADRGGDPQDRPEGVVEGTACVRSEEQSP